MFSKCLTHLQIGEKKKGKSYLGLYKRAASFFVRTLLPWMYTFILGLAYNIDV